LGTAVAADQAAVDAARQGGLGQAGANRRGHFGHRHRLRRKFSGGDALLQQVDTRRLQHLVAAHLSQENNRPRLAAAALATALGCHEDWIGVADQDGGFDWRQLI